MNSIIRDLSLLTMSLEEWAITTYLDRVVSDDDRQETIQSFSQLFHSLADVTSRVMLNVLRIKRLRVNC